MIRKNTLIILLLFFLLQTINSQTDNQTSSVQPETSEKEEEPSSEFLETGSSQSQKFYTIQTDLSAEEIKKLLNQPVTLLQKKSKNQKVEKSQKNPKKKRHIVAVLANGTQVIEDDEEILEHEIEEELIREAFYPIEDYRIKETAEKSDIKVLLNKGEKGYVNINGNRKFGRIVGFLTLVVLLVAVILFRDKLDNRKGEKISLMKINKIYYRNETEDESNEYLLQY